MTVELTVVWKKEMPILCGGCMIRFTPADGPVLGVDDRMLARGEVWPVIRCPGCRKTVSCSSAHVESYVAKERA